jgi:endogenous inhibitor of DNA gyrase (YacG/DUF329 family)
MSDARPPSGRKAPHHPRPCPICGAPATERDRPFCSPRCANVDLNRWLRGVYAIPASEEEGLPDPDEASGEQG